MYTSNEPVQNEPVERMAPSISLHNYTSFISALFAFNIFILLVLDMVVHYVYNIYSVFNYIIINVNFGACTPAMSENRMRQCFSAGRTEAASISQIVR